MYYHAKGILLLRNEKLTVEVIAFVVKLSSELSRYPSMRKRCFFYFKFTLVDEFELF